MFEKLLFNLLACSLFIIIFFKIIRKNDANYIMTSIITGASTYNQYKLSQIYGVDIDLKKLVDQYNSVVRKTKMYAPNDGLKARVIAVDEIYRRLYDVFNKKHFNIFIKVFMASFNDYEDRIKKIIDEYIKQENVI